MDEKGKVEQFLASIPTVKLRDNNIAAGRQRYQFGAFCKTGELMWRYLAEGKEEQLAELKALMDKQPLAFNNQESKESALFAAVEAMLVNDELCERSASVIAPRLRDIVQMAKEMYGDAFVHRMVNARCHPTELTAKVAWTVRDMMEKAEKKDVKVKCMSYIGLRPFLEIFEEYKFETTKVRGR